LQWWQLTLKDLENGKKAREPVAKMIQETKEKTHVKFSLLERIVDFQLFDIERGDI
jgi:hypothetical protein